MAEIKNVKTLIAFRFFVSFALSLMVIEFVLRFWLITPSRQIFDRDLGWQYIPNSKIIYSSEGYAVHKLNDLGLNDLSLTEKRSGKTVLVLGDSFTEALEVDRQNNFVSLLDQKFKDTDYINAGRGAYAPPHQIIVVERLSAYINADRNLLFLSHGDINDLVNTPLNIRRDSAGKILSLEPMNQIKDSIKDRFRFVLHNSSLATYLMRKYHLELKSILAYWEAPCILNCKQSRGTSSDQSNMIAQTHDNKKMLAYILSDISRYAPTLVFYIPNVYYGLNGNASITPYSKKELEVVFGASKLANTKIFNLAELFVDDYKKTGMPAFGFHNTRVGGEGHLNNYGHQLVADFVENSVRK